MRWSWLLIVAAALGATLLPLLEITQVPSFLKDKELAELWFYWAGVILPVITAVAIVFAAAQVRIARVQLAEERANSAIIAKQAQATLLLNLVDKWNSEKMMEGRTSWSKKEMEIRREIFASNPNSSDKDVMRKLKERFRPIMSDLRENDNEKYTSMLRVLSFFEIVGEQVKQQYVLLDDIDSLFRGPILEAGVIFQFHIEDRQKERGVPDGLFANALYLISEIEKRCPS